MAALRKSMRQCRFTPFAGAQTVIAACSVLQFLTDMHSISCQVLFTSKTAFLFLFLVFSFSSLAWIFFSPPCTHSKLLYEIMFLIKISSGNFTQSSSHLHNSICSRGLGAQRELSSAEVVIKHKQSKFDPRTISLSPKFCTSLRTEKQMPLLQQSRA